MIEHTDSQGRTWHALEREGGSISIYYTRAGSAAHYVVFDSLEGLAAHEDLRRENERLRAAIRLATEYLRTIAHDEDHSVLQALRAALATDRRAETAALLERTGI